ncbi:GLUT4 regulating protein TUG-domain-containing protein [Diplogelasinospora grovesii]|uniref:GLUT4 regulating protein TUG-domain-containing protein n=1 Tax=Diplogelasinospora grovesii TaxID=303347 RepID=A0AAN6NDE1_9PEZI|nr:GLUT4 regulating protein TUG-domain-containing protein [Diplogelasinospora grovesii]
MSAHVEVVSSDFKRAKVKVTPGTYLIDVLNEACQKLGLKSDKYLLKHKTKMVDLSGPFRTSGLGPGAKLELIQKSNSPSVLSIALDVNGQRYTKKLPSDMALWQVLRQFETAEKGLNITGRGSPKTSDGNAGSGQLYHEAPVVNIMGREYSSLEDLQKTLSQCGINSGSIVLRVAFKVTDKTLYDAMQDISRYLKDVEPGPNKEEAQQPTKAPAPAPVSEQPTETKEKPAMDTTETQTTSVAEQPHAPSVEPAATGDLMDLDEPSATQAPAAPAAPADPLQPTSVYSAPSDSTPAAARVQEEDWVYEPTIAHAQLRQHQLAARSMNTRLKSDEELAVEAAEEAARFAKISKVDIKVRFPDQTSAQWEVHKEHTGAFLYHAIRSVMSHPEQPFKLVMSVAPVGPNPKSGVAAGVIQDSETKLIDGYRLRGRELLNLVWEEAASPEARKAPFLKNSVASRAQAVVVPEVPQASKEEDAAGPSTAGPSKPDNKRSGGESGLDSEVLKKKLGKLFKLPGKK